MLNHAQKFPSKRGFVIFIPLIILVLIEAGYIAGGRYIGAVLLLAVMSALFLPVFFNTNYTIMNDGTLKVKCGMFLNTSVAIGSITKLEDTRSILSAPALSMHRLELFYNKFDSVVISPQDKAAFVAELQKINPGIRYNS